MRGKLNPYVVLGVALDATPDDIKKAYRRRALLNHPDKVGDTPEAKIAMQCINAAYEELTSPQASARAHAERSEAKPTNAYGFESARPHSGPQKPYKTRNYHFDPEDAGYFFGEDFKSPFEDMPDAFDGTTTTDWDHFWASFGKGSGSPKAKGRAKAKQNRTYQANEAFERRQKEARQHERDDPPPPKAWQQSASDRVDIEAKRAPYNEQYDFYSLDHTRANPAGLARDRGRSGDFLVVPTYAAVTKRLTHFNQTMVKILGGLCQILGWLVDVANIDRNSDRFLLAKDAFSDAVRTAGKYSTLQTEAGRLRANGWEATPEVVVCLLGELHALLRFLRPIEKSLNDVLTDFTEISRSRFLRYKLFDSKRRGILWAELKDFRASIEHLENQRGARFLYPEHLGR